MFHNYLLRHDNMTRAIVGAWLILLISSFLFYLKVRHLWVYVSIEILLALFAAGQTAHDFSNNIPAKDLPLDAVKMFGAVCVLIRGMDNWWKTPQMDKFKKYLAEQWKPTVIPMSEKISPEE